MPNVVIRRIVEILNQENSLLFASIPDRIAPYNYSDYSNGQRLKMWLLSFPQFAESDDKLSLVLKPSAHDSEDDKKGNSSVSVPPNWEVRCMHAFAYMNYWNQNVKQLKNLGIAEDVKSDSLRDHIAHVLMRDLLKGEVAIDYSVVDAPLLYVNTGFVFPDEHAVYAVLALNPINTDGTKQFWSMQGFGSTSKADTSELGDRLRSYFSVMDYANLGEQVDQLSAMVDALRVELQAFLTGLETGSCPNLKEETRLSRQIRDYEQQWQSLLEKIDGFSGLSDDAALSLAEIRAVTSEEACRAELLRMTVETFDSVSTGLENFFADNRWLSDGDSTPKMDRQVLQELYECGAPAKLLTKLRELLAYYRSLRTAMSSQGADDAFYDSYLLAKEHFSELPGERVAPRVLIVPEEERQFMNELDSVFQLVEQYVSAERKQTASVNLLLPESREELLQMALEADSTYCRNWPVYIKSVAPQEEALRALIMQGSGENTELTCFAAAERLQAAGQQDLAEQYLILGLLHDAARCVPVLLKLYREEKREEAFNAVLSRYKDQIDLSAEDEFYWFGILCAHSPEKALETAAANVQMMYLPAYLAHLATAADALEQTTLAETFRTRLDKWENAAEPDAFERAVIGGEQSAILEATQPEILREVGFDPERAEHIQRLAELGDYPSGTDAYAIGQRLYRFQSNRNGLAERWLWQGVSKQYQRSYAELLLVLTNEHRWEEAIHLYEANAEIQKRFEASRRFYLISRFYQSSTLAVEAFVENLQDVLVIMNLREDFRDKFAAISAEPGNAFYADVLKLYHAVKNPYLWSVVCEDRSLRDHVGDQQQMEALGLDVLKTSEAYRNGKYPHGTDAASIAARLYALANNLFGAAETAALLAGEDYSAQSLLWTIYGREKNETAMYQLLTQNERLRQEHHGEFMEFLYARGEYLPFLELLEQEDDLCEQQILQRATAELHTNRTLTDPPKTCADTAVNCSIHLSNSLLKIAAEKGETELVTQILCNCFEKCMREAPEQLAEFVGCGGMASHALLEEVQDKALENGVLTLAVYMQNALKIGDVQEQAAQLYAKLQEELQSTADANKLWCIRKMQSLYPEQADSLSSQAVEIAIRALLEQGNPSNRKEISEKLADLLNALDKNGEQLDVVLQMLDGLEYCWDFRVYTAISEWGNQVNRASDTLLFFHKTAQLEGADKKTYFRDFLIRLYYSALAEERFPVQIAKEAEQVCFQAVEQGTSQVAALCICMLEHLMGRRTYADAVLMNLVFATDELAEAPQKTLEEFRMEELPATLRMSDSVRNGLDLFEDILETCSEAQIMDYLYFCKRFLKENTGTLQELRNLSNGQTLSEQQSVSAINLLCSDPEKPEYWELCTRISFNIGDEARARFLHLCSRKNPNRWEEYIKLCEAKPALSGLLPAAFAAWAECPAPYCHECRMYLEDKLEENPAYLAGAEDQESLYALTSRMCGQLKGYAKGWNHAQIRAVALIAVSTGNCDCLACLQKDVGHLLFGEKSDLGVVVVSHLLLAGRTAEALEWVEKLNNSVAVIKYRSLIEELAPLSVEQLDAWCALPSNKTFLRLILPDGNQPNVDQIISISKDAFLNGTVAETASVLRHLLSIFPEDYASSYELMELCMTGFEGSIPMLHFSLLNLLRIPEPMEASRVFYNRTSAAHSSALAILNQLIIHQNLMHTIDDGWNFEHTTAQGLVNMGVVVRNPAVLSHVEQHVRDSLENQPAGVREHRICAWMASITGNWTAYLERAFRTNQRASDVYIPENIVTEQGMTRSLLRLFRQIPAEQHRALRSWLQVLFIREDWKKQVELAGSLVKEGVLDHLQSLESVPVELLLQFPAENYGLFKKMEEFVLQPALSKGTSYIHSLVWLLCAIGGNGAVMRDMHILAGKYFDNGQDEIAWCFYNALFRTGSALNLTHNNSNLDKKSAVRYNMEEYQARFRIAGAFSGNEDCVRKLANPELSAWSAMNLFLTLAASSRADEILRLADYMDPGRAYLAEKVLIILDANIEDEEKVEMVLDPTLGTIDQYYLAKLLKSPVEYGNQTMPYYLRSQQIALRMDYEHRQIYNAQKDNFSNKTWQQILLVQNLDYQHIGRNIAAQKDPGLWEKHEVSDVVSRAYEYVAPAYVADLTPLEGLPEDLRAVFDRYLQLQADYPHGHFGEKAALAEEIYRRTLGVNSAAEAKYRAMLRYSVDQFYNLISNPSAETKAQAAQLLLELLETDNNSGAQEGSEHEALVGLINTVGATNLLKSHKDIRSMINAYTEHRNAFVRLRGMIRDSIVFRDISTIYDALEKLVKPFSLAASAEVNVLIQALDEADSLIGAISGISWADVKGHIQRMIRVERNQLATRAILDINIQNQGNQHRTGYLQGTVTNTGTLSAENLTLQAFVGESNNNPQYILPQLAPNAKAVFEIPYTAAEDAQVLQGYLDLIGQSNGTIVSVRKDVNLTLGETSGEELLSHTYVTDKPGQFVYDPETGTVKNDKFFGRAAETSKLRELVSDGDFADCHSAIVYGVRRTGKTALLEYFVAYVLGVRTDCLCFRIDVQLTDLTIYGVFIEGVLKERSVKQALEASGDLDTFNETWRDKRAEVESDPLLLRDFFMELAEMTGKGLYLIVDEIDRLFKRMMDDHEEKTLNILLRTISGILDAADSKNYLQLVICGSNWLMHYTSVGYDMQQMFQRFGDYKIKVGRLPKEDVMRLLKSVPVNYTPGALEMIWEYTGGLAWFVKLLANAAIRRAKSFNRPWIYSADVYYSLKDVLCDRNCEQFYEGCIPGSLERQLIDSMQSLAYRKDMYLSVDKLCELLGKDPAEVERAIKKLIEFDIAERDAVNPDKVQFSLDIYRRYFRTVHSAHKRIPEEPDAFERKADVVIVGASFDDDERI